VKKSCNANAFLPAFMRMDEFESRAILVDTYSLIDKVSRVMLLREAAKFDSIEKLHINFDLVRFFTKSEALFKFFEELSHEKVDFTKLKDADVYSEFPEHIAILQSLQERYEALLQKRGYTDRAFLPQIFYLNEDFIRDYEEIELYIEGYLSRFELDILDEVSKLTHLKLFVHTSKFTLKMDERFADYGIMLPKNSQVCVDFSAKTILKSQKNNLHIDAQVIKVNERIKQIPVALFEVQKMIERGIDPEDIAIVLPDEDYKEMFVLFDREENLNFAMGFDYKQSKEFKTILALGRYFQKGKIEEIGKFAIDIEYLKLLRYLQKISVDQFFKHLFALTGFNFEYLKEQSKYQKVYQSYMEFLSLFDEFQLSLQEWIFLWLKSIEEITLDDNRGGKVTVIGALETRGVAFEGIIIVDFNEGIIPSLPAKDQFLNSSVRAFASLPTKKDREALQKQLYKRVLEQAQYATIIFSNDNHKSPSRFIYELLLGDDFKVIDIDPNFFYSDTKVPIENNESVAFDARAVMWSSSKLETFLMCKRKYYFRYIKNIKPSIEDEINDGVVLHDLLYRVFEHHSSFEDESTLSDVIEDTLEKLELPETFGAYKKLLWMKKLEYFIHAQVKHFHSGWRVQEKEFVIEGTIDELRFTGRIDRVDVKGDEAFILDYKSGSTSRINKGEKALESNFHYQMNIYTHLLQKRYKQIRSAYVKIFDIQQFEEPKAFEQKDVLLLEQIKQIKNIKEFTPNKCEDLTRCTYCEFRLTCQRGEYL
ncbi:MAG: PD-(D/E)XK nuclease family protein, partial [Campylobacterales bacterium]|nr:PD-(D/E)XK nuclease family protein [Campylobacterales bacterium]